MTAAHQNAPGELLETIADAIRSTGHVTNADKWECAEALKAALRIEAAPKVAP